MKVLMMCLISISIFAGPADKVYEGKDYKGNIKQCSPMKQSICTMEFTEEDQFGADCKKSGKLAIQCGCHSWICVEQKKSQ